jgi:RNA polymerase sigma-70 factor (ECF subfamily)
MSHLMILPAPAVQEDFTPLTFSDRLLLSVLQVLRTSAGTDLSCPWDRSTSPTTDTINRSLRSGEDTSEAAQRSDYQLQEAANETMGRVEYEPQPIVSQSTSQDATDADLVEQAATGNERAFEVLVQRYETQIKQFVYHHLAHTDDVQDVVQFVFLQLYLYLPRLKGRLIPTHSQWPLKPWLLKVARNRCHDERRKKHPCLFSELETTTEEGSNPLEYIPDMSPLPEDAAELHDRQLLIQTAIQGLPPRYRLIVSLRYREELTFREIGRRLNMAENTAKTYFQRARPLLRASLTSL